MAVTRTLLNATHHDYQPGEAGLVFDRNPDVVVNPKVKDRANWRIPRAAKVVIAVEFVKAEERGKFVMQGDMNIESRGDDSEPGER